MIADFLILLVLAGPRCGWRSIVALIGGGVVSLNRSTNIQTPAGTDAV